MKLNLSDDTRVPIRWVFALLVGCASTMGGAVLIGNYVGNNEARAQAVDKRILSLEAALESIPMIDRRLARIEGAQGIQVPKAERFPASKELEK